MKRPSKWLATAITGSVLFTGAVSYGAIAHSAHASTIQPYPTALQGRPLAINDTGAQLVTAWDEHPSNSPGNCSNNRVAGITTSGSNVIFTSNGNDCVLLQTKHLYPTTDGYVYEQKVVISNWTQWLSYWAYGNNWPVDGEIDSIEASPTGQNNISYHNNTTFPDGYSTCSSANGCNPNQRPIDTPSNATQLAESLGTGTHIVDIAFGGCGSGCGAISVWIDGTEYAFVHGTDVLAGGSPDDPYWFVTGTGKPETGSCGNPCGTFEVEYWRVWT